MNIQLDTDWFVSAHNQYWNWKGFQGNDTFNRLGYTWGEGGGGFDWERQENGSPELHIIDSENIDLFCNN